METFKDELEIDHNALDIEWLEQPKRFFEVAEQAAEAKRDVERAKLALEVAEAELDNDIRTNPATYGIAKITEGAIKSAIAVSAKYQDASNAYADAQYNNNMLQSAVAAWDQRKRALENLVYLHGQSYFAGPSVPRDINAQMVAKGDRSMRRRVIESVSDKSV